MFKYKQLKSTPVLEFVLFGILILLYCTYIFQSFKYIYLSIVQHFDTVFSLMVLLLIYWVIQQKKHIEKLAIKPVYASYWNVVSFTVIGISYYLIDLYLHINLITTVIGLTGLYVLLSFIVPYNAWKKGIIPFMLLLMCLPFGRQLDTYIGFPLRMLSVDLVAMQMKWMGFHLTSRDTILIIENNASQVDIDCSGLKGLWVGLIFFIAYSWINHLKINLKWLGLAAVLLGSIIFFNLIRISILVLINSIEGYEKGVEYFHYSISAFGIVLSCLLVHCLALYFKLNTNPTFSYPNTSNTQKNISPWYLAIPNIVLLIFLSIPQTSVTKPIQKALPLLQSNEYFTIEHIGFKKRERAVFERDGSAAFKFKFTFKNITGEAIVVRGADWRAQHKPELCFEAAGNKLKSIQTIILNDSFPVKYIQFNNTQEVVYSWFQSPKIITEDYSYRNWLELSGKESNWMLINLVIREQDYQQTKDLLLFLNSQINHSFKQPIIY